MKKQYIGDGLYADYDGYQIELSTPQGNKVFLEPDVIKSFMEYIEKTLNVKIKVTKNETP